MKVESFESYKEGFSEPRTETVFRELYSKYLDRMYNNYLYDWIDMQHCMSPTRPWTKQRAKYLFHRIKMRTCYYARKAIYTIFK